MWESFDDIFLKKNEVLIPHHLYHFFVYQELFQKTELMKKGCYTWITGITGFSLIQVWTLGDQLENTENWTDTRRRLVRGRMTVTPHTVSPHYHVLSRVVRRIFRNFMHWKVLTGTDSSSKFPSNESSDFMSGADQNSTNSLISKRLKIWIEYLNFYMTL